MDEESRPPKRRRRVNQETQGPEVMCIDNTLSSKQSLPVTNFKPGSHHSPQPTQRSQILGRSGSVFCNRDPTRVEIAIDGTTEFNESNRLKRCLAAIRAKL